jgi:two-component system OmpR family sensor kinase
MVVAIAALAAFGLIVADVTGMLLLRSSLVERVDASLGGVFRQFNRSPGWTCEPATPATSEPEAAKRPGLGPVSSSRYYTSTGAVCYGPTNGSSEPDLGTFAGLKAHVDRGPYTVNGAAGPWRVEVRSLPASGGFGAAPGGFGVVAVSLAEVQATEDTLVLINVAVTLLVLVGIGVAAAKVVSLGLRPLTRMETAAAEIAGGDLSRRVEDADPHTESGRLGTALNTMLVRIETAMADRTASEQRLRQFLADAAHELRTPLTSIQGFAELYRRGGARPGPELDEAMGAIESEVGRMRLLVNDLLLLARMDEERPLGQHQVDLLEVAADTIRDAHVRVPTRFVLLGPLDDRDDTFDRVTVHGDEARLRQVATNLVANALQHTPDDAEVVVRVGRAKPATGGAAAVGTIMARPAAVAGHELASDEPVAVIEVADTGPGMPSGDAARVFERLYRADASRSRRHGGAGLGLSIVAAIVQAHGGRCELWTAPGRGARFRVLLPAGPALGEPPVSEDEADYEVALS